MNHSAHKPESKNRTFPVPVCLLYSNIAVSWLLSLMRQVERRAEVVQALPRCSNVAYFTGKEKDWESGFHYYGARYYWSEVLTGWPN